MIRYLTADYVLPVSSVPLKNGVIAMDGEGRILDLFKKDSPELMDKPVEKFRGIISPGFVNSHCHLELSHLHQKIAKHRGLVPFITEVLDKRSVTDLEVQQEAMREADKTMFENGIVAAGDISNTDVSYGIKEQSALYYHTYVELIGFNPQKAGEIIENGLALRKKFDPMPVSIAPHAPYSVSKELFRRIGDLSRNGRNLLSVHNQESREENKFFRYKSGQFLSLYDHLKLNIDFFKASGKSSLQTFLPFFQEKQTLLLVHNTYTGLKDIYFTRRRHDMDISWCFCPNANLYIEDHLPKIELFLYHDLDIMLGTDSLASNNELCILSEMKTLHANFPALPLTKTIAWATLNGARYLSIDKKFGSIEKGKKPGLNLITNVNGLNLTKNSKIKKLA